jgi:hypothetical protein
MMVPPVSPARLTRQWIALLLPPVAWVTALGAMFSITDESCSRGGHAGLWSIVGVCALLAVVGAPLAWRERRRAGEGGDVDRTRFMMELALGLSALFSLIVIMNAIPILLLSPCRT